MFSLYWIALDCSFVWIKSVIGVMFVLFYYLLPLPKTTINRNSPHDFNQNYQQVTLSVARTSCRFEHVMFFWCPESERL